MRARPRSHARIPPCSQTRSPAAPRCPRRPSSPLPPDHYHLLGDLPVDIIAGSGDGIIRAEDAQRHYERLSAAGVPASFRVFRCSHLDLTFAVLDEVRTYILAQLAKPAL